MATITERSEEETQIVTIDVQTAKDLLTNSGHRYLDVRTVEEYKMGHLDVENIFNVAYMVFTSEGNVKNPNFVEQVSTLCGKDEYLIVGCQGGGRSVPATRDLLNAGFKHVYNMGGGYIAWKENGFPVREPNEETQIVTVNVQTANDLLTNSGYRFLDVRTAEEYKEGTVAVENRFNVPYMFFTPQGNVKNPDFVEQVSALSGKDEHLVVGCQVGVKSAWATTDLLNVGFKHLYNMGGGYDAWKENGFPVTESHVLID